MINWFDWELEGLRETREFLEAVQNEAALWHDSRAEVSQVYERPGGITLGIDVGDRDEKLVVRTLRVDYNGDGLRCGEDETGQFVTPLSSGAQEFHEVPHHGRSAAEMGRLAASWLRSEMVRPIRCSVWQRGSWWMKRYQLADTARWLCWSAADNEPRTKLGEPDEVLEVHT